MPANEEVDLQPDTMDALQAEDPSLAPAVAVKHEGPLRVQSLPRKAAGTRTRTVGTTASKVLAADHRRASALIMSIGQNMLFAFNSASAQDPSTMSLWPANVPFTLTADTELWVASATATTSISITSEFWATGE